MSNKIFDKRAIPTVDRSVLCVIIIVFYACLPWILLSGQGENTQALQETPRPTIGELLPETALYPRSIGGDWYEVSISSGAKHFCFLFNSHTKGLDKLHNGMCGSPEPKYEAEVTITSDDVLNAITGKKLIFLSKKGVKNESKVSE